MNEKLKCPRCKGEITRGEPKCTHCGVMLKWRSSLQNSEPRKETSEVPGAMTVRLPPPPTETAQSAGAKFCAQCGTRLVAEQRFCSECGTRTDGGAGPGPVRVPLGEGDPPEGMRKLTADERPPSFPEAWGRGWQVSCTGRATRQEFWLRFLSVCIEVLSLAGLTGIFWYMGQVIAARVLAWVYAVLMLLPSLCLLARRCHDTGRSGVWTLVLCLATLPWSVLSGLVAGKSGYELYQMAQAGFLPSPSLMRAVELLAFAVGVITLLLALLPSQDEANKWGPNPHKPFAPKIRPSR